MSILNTIRLSLWGAAIVCSTITLGLAANWLSSTPPFYRYYDVFIIFAIATSALTLLVLPALIAIDFATDKTRNTAPTSMIMVEMAAITILWFLWLASASLTINDRARLGYGTCFDCHEYNSIQAFSVLAWLCLMVYDIILLVFTLIAYNRGQTSVWRQSVKQTNFLAPRANLLQGIPATAVVAGGFTPAPQYVPAGAYTVPCVLVVLPQEQQQQQSQQPQFQLLFQQPPFPQSPLQSPPLQQSPSQDGGSAPADPPQPLQSQTTSPDVQPGDNQV